MTYRQVLYKSASQEQTWKPNFNLGSGLKWGLGTAALTLPAAKLLGAGWDKSVLFSLLAGGLGFLGKSFYDVLQGNPFTASQQTMPKGKDVYIGVTGGGDGRGSSFHSLMRTRYGKDNIAMFRWSDRTALRNFIREAAAAGKRIHGRGHSYGGSSLLNQAKNSGVPIQDVSTYDPASWTERVYSKPSNIKTWTNWIPDRKGPKRGAQMIANIGGRWGNIPGSKIVPNTDHVNIMYSDM